MKVLREVKMEVSRFEVGDRIKVNLMQESHTATAIRDEGDGMLFLFDECLDEAKPMNEKGGTEGGYEESDMRKHLQRVAKEMPKKLRKRMMPFEDGDYLYLLTLQEACGCNTDWNDCEGQIPWMKDRRHRISTRKGDEYEWYWLSDVVSAARFAYCDTGGDASYTTASNSGGVRPAFKIKNI